MRRVNGVWEKLGERGARESEGQILKEIFNYGVPGENRKVYKVFSRSSVENDIIKDQLGEAIENFSLGEGVSASTSVYQSQLDVSFENSERNRFGPLDV